MSFNDTITLDLLTSLIHKERGCQFCSDNPKSVEHYWGCQIFDWGELNKAMEYFQERTKGLTSVKEKYGAMCVSMWGITSEEDYNLIRTVWLETADKFPVVRPQILNEFAVYFWR